MRRKGLSTRKRFAILTRDKFKCGYCGAPPTRYELEVDHIVPVAEGGNDSNENLITACWRCNAGKSDKLIKNPNLFQIDHDYKKKSKKREPLPKVITKLIIPEEMRIVLDWCRTEFGMDPRLLCLIGIRDRLNCLRFNPPPMFGKHKQPPDVDLIISRQGNHKKKRNNHLKVATDENVLPFVRQAEE